MKEFFQKYKAQSGKFKGEIVITVCTIMDEAGKTGRGVAVCSPMDSPVDLSGEWYSRCHAMHSIKGRPDVAITDDRAIQTLLRTNCPFTMKSEMYPKLTFQEIAFFYGKKNLVERVETSNHTNNKPTGFLSLKSLNCGDGNVGFWGNV